MLAEAKGRDEGKGELEANPRESKGEGRVQMWSGSTSHRRWSPRVKVNKGEQSRRAKGDGEGVKANAEWRGEGEGQVQGCQRVNSRITRTRFPRLRV